MTELERLQALCEEQRKQIENYQDYKVMKDKNGKVLFQDSVSYRASSLEELSPEKRKRFVPGKFFYMWLDRAF